MKYKVLWIDDDYKTQIDFIGQAEQEGIDVKPFESHEEGIEELNKNLPLYHAVILDAKVKKLKEDTVTGLGGLTASRDRLIEINKENYLPFFIFTGQPDYVGSSLFKETFENYYVKARDNDKLFKAIISSVENKEEYQIRRDYKSVFEVCTAKYIGEEYQNILLKILEAIKKPHERFDDKLYFTQIRIMLEQVLRSCYNIGLLHDKCVKKGIVNLTESTSFLSGAEITHLKIKCSKAHFPKIIANNVKLIIEVTGAASHTSDALQQSGKVSIAEYRAYLTTPYLLYSLTFQLMDILLWFKKYADQYPDKDANKLLWETL